MGLALWNYKPADYFSVVFQKLSAREAGGEASDAGFIGSASASGQSRSGHLRSRGSPESKADARDSRRSANNASGSAWTVDGAATSSAAGGSGGRDRDRDRGSGSSGDIFSDTESVSYALQAAVIARLLTNPQQAQQFSRTLLV